jgi:hypothetical protein
MPPNFKIRDDQGRWLAPSQLTSKMIRVILKGQDFMLPKIIHLDDECKVTYFKKISCIQNVANKTKMLRLLHGDVFTAERLKRFNMSDSDKCRRCFAKETITHLLVDCPYSLEVYNKAGVQHIDLDRALGITLSAHELEVWSELIINIVFKMQIMPPQTLVRTTVEKFANGLAYKKKVKQHAMRMLRYV